MFSLATRKRECWEKEFLFFETPVTITTTADAKAIAYFVSQDYLAEF